MSQQLLMDSEEFVKSIKNAILYISKRVAPKGNISGADLIMLQGLVCLLKDTENLIFHSRKLINGYGPATVLDALLENSSRAQGDKSRGAVGEEKQALDDEAALPELPPLQSEVNIPGMRL